MIRPPQKDAEARDTNSVSAVTEATVLSTLIKAGYPCYIPFGVGKADLVIETSDGLKAVQCKTGQLLRGGSVIRFRSTTVLRAGGYMGYVGLADYFAVVCPGVSGVFLVPVGDVPIGTPCLRLIPSTNNQEKGVRWANDYLINPL